MKQRIIAFVILWSLLIAAPLLFGTWGVFALIALFAIGTSYELNHLLAHHGHAVDRPVVYTGLVGILGIAILVPIGHLPPFAIIAIAFAGVMAASLLRSEVGAIMQSLERNLAAVFIPAIPFLCMVLLLKEFPSHHQGLFICLWIIAVAKFTDVGALLAGMAFGKHRMAPLLSPKKTWEGLAGGIVAAIIISIGFALTMGDYLPVAIDAWNAAWMAVPIAFAGVLSDLIESAFKREAQVKDSGRIIPGIGGIFDLTDSMMIAFPVGYFLIWMVI